MRREAGDPERWLNVRARQLNDKDGIARGRVAMFTDVTAHRAAEAEIRALNASLELRVQARTVELRKQARYLRVLIDALP